MLHKKKCSTELTIYHKHLNWKVILPKWNPYIQLQTNIRIIYITNEFEEISFRNVLFSIDVYVMWYAYRIQTLWKWFGMQNMLSSVHAIQMNCLYFIISCNSLYVCVCVLTILFFLSFFHHVIFFNSINLLSHIVFFCRWKIQYSSTIDQCKQH